MLACRAFYVLRVIHGARLLELVCAIRLGAPLCATGFEADDFH